MGFFFLVIMSFFSLGHSLEVTKLTKSFTDDFKKAQFMAQVYQKPMVLLFVGSDWCPNSQYLLNSLEKEGGFFDVIEHQFIVVKIDFKEVSSVNADQLQSHYELKSKYGIENFPAIVILDEYGSRFQKIESIPDNGETLAKLILSTEKKLHHVQ